MATTESKRPTAKHKFEGHENTVWSFVFLHDNVHIVSGSEDGTMRKWSCDTGLLVGEPWESEGGLIQTLALSSDGQTIACVRGDGSVQLWDTSGKKNGVWEGHNRGSLSWSPSGGHIANGAHDGTILIRNAKSGKVKVGPIQTNQGGVDILQYSPSGEKIASGGENETIYIWDSNTGDHLVGPIKHVGGWITSVAWSVDGGELYSASDSNFIRVFDSVSGALLRWLEHDHRVYSVALSPKNNLLACVGINGTARLWDTELHQPFGQPFGEEGQERLYCASFSQDGKYLAYGGDHNTVTLWMVEDIAPELLKLQETQSQSVDATNSFGRPGNDGITEEGHGDIYGDHFWSHTPSSPFSPYQCPRPSPARRLLNILIPSQTTPYGPSLQCPRPSPARRLLNILIPSRTTPPASESVPIALQGCPKRSFPTQQTRPRPVTVSAGRPRKLYWRAPRPAQTQPVTGPAQEEHDYGCWDTFWIAVCCISRHPPTVQPAAS